MNSVAFQKLPHKNGGVFDQELRTQRANPLTGSFEAVLVTDRDRHGGALRNVCWTDSGFIGVDPIPSPDVENFYRKEYRQNYKGAVAPRARHVLRAARVASDRLKQIAGVFPRILGSPLHTFDAGASSGEFVFLMQKLGHSAAGLEAHEGYAHHAREVLGLNVSNGVFSEFDAGTKSFEVITLFHVLEHLEFPVEDLKRLAASLHPEGIFVIEVPNILYRGMRFRHKWHAAHLNGFSLKTLRATAQSAGLEPLLCLECGEGGNLFGVFRKTAKASPQTHISSSLGAEPELRALAENSDSDYFLRAGTWTKIAPKIFSQIEERWTASRFKNSTEMLHSVYDSGLRSLR